MPLKLAGEFLDALNGVDNLGWLREIEAADASPGLKVTQESSGVSLDITQNGTGIALDVANIGGTEIARFIGYASLPTIRFRRGSATIGYLKLPASGLSLEGMDSYGVALKAADGNVQLESSTGVVDVRSVIKNLGSANDGEVAFDDDVKLINGRSLRLRDSGGAFQVGLVSDQQSVSLQQRATHIADGSVGEDTAHLYIYSSGGTRQLVIKYKDGGTVYTGTVNLT